MFIISIDLVPTVIAMTYQVGNSYQQLKPSTCCAYNKLSISVQLNFTLHGKSNYTCVAFNPNSERPNNALILEIQKFIFSENYLKINKLSDKCFVFFWGGGLFWGGRIFKKIDYVFKNKNKVHFDTLLVTYTMPTNFIELCYKALEFDCKSNK